MNYKFACPHCGQHVEAPEQMVGETVACPTCKTSFNLGQRTQPPPLPLQGNARTQGKGDTAKIAGWVAAAVCGLGAVLSMVDAQNAKARQAVAEAQRDAANREVAMGQNSQSLKAVLAAGFRKAGFTDVQIAQMLRDDLPTAEKEAILQERAFSHLLADNRPASNFIIKDSLSAGGEKATLELNNGLKEDAYVKVIRTGTCVASFYIRGNSSFTFAGIPDGQYLVAYCVGFGWDEEAKDFRRGRKATKFDAPLFYAKRTQRTATSETVFFNQMTLTLHTVQSGNARASDISTDEFDRY